MLKKGDLVRLIAPAHSYAIVKELQREIAEMRLTEELGLRISFGKHVEEKDEFDSSSIESRIEDLHEAFADPEVKGIIAIEGGFNSNQLLDDIDWDLIRKNPKIFCGYSDLTVLCAAIYAKTGLITYHGPLFSTFGQKKYFDYSLEYFKKCVMSDEPFEIVSSPSWSDDDWEADQDNRTLIDNPGPFVINEGEAEGTAIGGNLSTINLLQGTKYLPDLKNSILFIEEDYEAKAYHFDRWLTSLIQQPGFIKVRAVLIGRFEGASKISREDILKIIKTKKALGNIPVVANLDFGHTSPKFTFPIGGVAQISASFKSGLKLQIIKH